MISGLAAVPAWAQDTNGQFSARTFGVKVGDFVLNGSVTDSRYAVRSKFVTTGLAGAVAGVRGDLAADGVRQGIGFCRAATAKK